MITTIVHWKEPSELKTFDKPVVCITKRGKIMTFTTNYGTEKSWLWHVEKYQVKYWAFISEITPNE